jgi:hypothetical protein
VATRVLYGEYDSNYPIDPFFMLVLRHLSMPAKIRNTLPQDMHRFLNGYSTFGRRANKNISCYPLALSFSTIKAKSLDDSIAELEWMLTKIPMERGFSPHAGDVAMT